MGIICLSDDFFLVHCLCLDSCCLASFLGSCIAIRGEDIFFLNSKGGISWIAVSSIYPDTLLD